jgi:DNA-directed RNA polymerase specialized sigma24 family protein
MTLTQYLEENYDELKNIVANITKNHQDKNDLLQEVILILYDYDQVKLQEIINKKHIKFFIVGIMINQYNSATSPFHKKYRSKTIEYVDEYNTNIIDTEHYDEEIDNQVKFIQKELDGAHWYVKRVVELKTEMSYQKIKDLTGIPRSSLFSTVDRFRKETVEKYNKINKEK